jgi:hypothetical protein
MIDLFYIALSLVFAAVIAYMVVYNRRHKTPPDRQHEHGRERVTTHERIATTAEEKKLKDKS